MEKSFPAPRAPKQRNGSASSSGFHWLWKFYDYYYVGFDDGDLLSMMNNQDGRAPALGPGGDFKKVSRWGKLKKKSAPILCVDIMWAPPLCKSSKNHWYLVNFARNVKG